MKTEKTENPLREYLDEHDMSISEFGRLSLIPNTTVDDAVNGRTKVSRRTAIKICKATKFYITLADFGLE